MLGQAQARTGSMEGRGSSGEEALYREALEHPEAAASWLIIYRSFFRSLVYATAKRLYQELGVEAGSVQFAGIVEETGRLILEAQKAAAKAKGVRLETLEDLFAVNQACHHDAAKRLAPLGLEIFNIGRMDHRYYMETGRCGVFSRLEEVPILRVFPIAFVSGLINGMGFRSRWLSSIKERNMFCKSSHRETYDYIVYLDEEVQPPGCRILVEPVKQCS